MLKLGKIYHSGELVNHEKLDYIEYVDHNTHVLTKDIFSEFTTPTLIVGWSIVKEMIAISENLDVKANITILDKKIVSKSLYWEYGFNENKHFHISGIENFAISVPEYFFSSRYNYINIDPVFFSIEEMSDLLDYLPKEDLKIYNFKNEMLYILYNDKISGIDLKLYKYFGFDVDTIVSKLRERSTGYVDDSAGMVYQTFQSKFPEFDNLKRYIIVILSNP